MTTIVHDRIITRRHIASHGGFEPEVREVVHAVLLTIPDAAQALASSPEISTMTFAALWGQRRPEVDLARTLAERRLGPAEQLLLATREDRGTVLEGFLAHNEPTPEALAMFAARPSVAGAKALLGSCAIPSEHRRDLALKAGGRELLREMAYGDEGRFTDEEVLGLLAKFETLRPTQKRHELPPLLQTVFIRRPSVVVPALALDYGRYRNSVLHAMASSTTLGLDEADVVIWETMRPELTREEMRRLRMVHTRLAENPRCHARSLRALSDAMRQRSSGHSIEHLLRNRIPGVQGDLKELAEPRDIAAFIAFALGSGWRTPNLWTLVELAGNPNLLPLHRERIQRALLDGAQESALHQVSSRLAGNGFHVVPPTRTPATRTPEDAPLCAALANAAATLGTSRSAWEVLLTLVDEFDGRFEELVATAASV